MILMANITAIALMIAGMLLCVAVSVGLIRFRDTISRIHASSKPQTLGLVLVLSSSLVHAATRTSARVTTSSDLVLLTLIILFALGTSPIVNNRAGRETFKERLVGGDSPARGDSQE